MAANAPKTFRPSWRNALGCAFVCALLGLLALPYAHELVLLSYDLLPLFRKTSPVHDLTIIYMDDRSFAALKQNRTQNWDRNLHAALVNRLSADGAKVVVFDVVFDSPSDATADTNFAAALRFNGRVVLAAGLDPEIRPQIQVKGPVLPTSELLEASAGWGIAAVTSPRGSITRQYYEGTETQPSLPGAAAALVMPSLRATDVRGTAAPRWLNYYGSWKSLPSQSYVAVTNLPPGFFRDQAVFIGALPKTLRADDEADVFRTPHGLWGEELFPGVAVTATAYLNQVRGDGLVEMSRPNQCLILGWAGLFVGGLLGFLRPLQSILAAAGLVVLCLVAAFVAANQHIWFAWSVIAFAQVPLTLAWTILSYRLRFENIVLEETLAATTRRATTDGAGDTIQIPDHTLLRCVGKGAYGEVWLARSTIGVYHAVKLVKRDAFPSDEPYEREFRGMQKFMPISRGHPGFVHVLHVGRNDIARFFFYIMEVSDDTTSGQKIEPERYVPKTLASQLAQRGQLTPMESLELGLALALALEHLHRQGLIHRDIKPANIIYVDNSPKFADIGLVTEIAATGQEVSELGTKGYVPPEGPGRASADVYALGKVLYEAALGRDRLLFPEVPTALLEQGDEELLKQLHHVISRTCATDLTERYTSAEALHAALLRLLKK